MPLAAIRAIRAIRASSAAAREPFGRLLPPNEERLLSIRTRNKEDL
jgi:hypothetical protein